MLSKKKKSLQLIDNTQSYFQNLLIVDEENSEYTLFIEKVKQIKQNLQSENDLFVVTDNRPSLIETLEKQKFYFEKGKASEEFDLFFDIPEFESKKIRYKCCSESFFQENMDDADGVIFINDANRQFQTAEEIAQASITWEEIQGNVSFSKILKEFYLKVEYQKTEKVLEIFKTQIEQQKQDLTALKTIQRGNMEEMETSLMRFRDDIETLLTVNGKLFSLELSESIHSIPSDHSNKDFQDCIEAYCEQAYDMIEEFVEKYEKRLNDEMNQIKKSYPVVKTQRNTLKNTIEVDLEDDFLKLSLKTSKNKSFQTFLKSSFKQNLFLNLAMYCLIVLCCVVIFQLPLERKIPVVGFKYTIIGLGDPVRLFDGVDLSKVSEDIMENPVKFGSIGFTILGVALGVMIVSILILILSNWTLFKIEIKLQRETLSEQMRKRWYTLNKAAFFREQFTETYERETLRDLNEIVRTNKERIKYLADNTLEGVNESILFIKDVEDEIKKIETEVYYE